MGPPTFHVFLPIRGVRGVKYKIEKCKKKNKKKHTMKCKLDRKHPTKSQHASMPTGPGANPVACGNSSAPGPREDSLQAKD